MAGLPYIVFDVNETLLRSRDLGADIRAHLRRQTRHAAVVRELDPVFGD
jgi:hypothetical protein